MPARRDAEGCAGFAVARDHQPTCAKLGRDDRDGVGACMSEDRSPEGPDDGELVWRVTRGPGRPVGLDEARQLAEEAMWSEPLFVVSCGEVTGGWAFFLQPARYMETRSDLDLAIGQGPTFVERSTGYVYKVGQRLARPVEGSGVRSRSRGRDRRSASARANSSVRRSACTTRSSSHRRPRSRIESRATDFGCTYSTPLAYDGSCSPARSPTSCAEPLLPQAEH